jgi:hypothetical protein
MELVVVVVVVVVATVVVALVVRVVELAVVVVILVVVIVVVIVLVVVEMVVGLIAPLDAYARSIAFRLTRFLMRYSKSELRLLSTISPSPCHPPPVISIRIHLHPCPSTVTR